MAQDRGHLPDQFGQERLEELLENYNQDNAHLCQVLVLVKFVQVLQHVHHLIIKVLTMVHLLHLVLVHHHLPIAPHQHLHLLHHGVAQVAVDHHKEVAQLVHLVKVVKVVKEKIEDKRVRKKDVKILKIYQHHN